MNIGVEDILSPVSIIHKKGETSTLIAIPEEKLDHPQSQEYEGVIVNPLYLEQMVKIGQSLSIE